MPTLLAKSKLSVNTNRLVLRLKGAATRNIKRIEQAARRRHTPRRARTAPVPSGPSASQAGLRRRSRLIRLLYGQSLGIQCGPQ